MNEFICLLFSERVKEKKTGTDVFHVAAEFGFTFGGITGIRVTSLSPKKPPTVFHRKIK